MSLFLHIKIIIFFLSFLAFSACQTSDVAPQQNIKQPEARRSGRVQLLPPVKNIKTLQISVDGSSWATVKRVGKHFVAPDGHYYNFLFEPLISDTLDLNIELGQKMPTGAVPGRKLSIKAQVKDGSTLEYQFQETESGLYGGSAYEKGLLHWPPSFWDDWREVAKKDNKYIDYRFFHFDISQAVALSITSETMKYTWDLKALNKTTPNSNALLYQINALAPEVPWQTRENCPSSKKQLRTVMIKGAGGVTLAKLELCIDNGRLWGKAGEGDFYLLPNQSSRLVGLIIVLVREGGETAALMEQISEN